MTQAKIKVTLDPAEFHSGFYEWLEEKGHNVSWADFNSVQGVEAGVSELFSTLLDSYVEEIQGRG